jgi:hypothetical protein
MPNAAASRTPPKRRAGEIDEGRRIMRCKGKFPFRFTFKASAEVGYRDNVAPP